MKPSQSLYIDAVVVVGLKEQVVMLTQGSNCIDRADGEMGNDYS